MILNCVIVDDEPMARKLLQEYIEETDFLKLVGVAENPLKAAGIISSEQVDLLFLDINMPKMNGMEFLRSATNLPLVIITTAYGQYALDGFELAVVDYLVKPFALERFFKAAQKALELKSLKDKKVISDDNNPEYFYVKCDGRLQQIVYNQLLYIEALANYITLYTINGKYVVYLTLKGILEKMPAEQFIQVHKSIVVNLKYINAIEGNILYVQNHKITVSVSFQEQVADKVLKNRLIKR